MRPALSPEARENQMISLAVDLVEKRLREGTASSAETTYYLRLSGSKARLEKEKLEEENKLLRAKTEALQAAKNTEERDDNCMKTRKASSGEDVGLRPALSPEARENQMISLAVDLVEKRLREGTASSAETTYYLRLSGSKARLEKEKLEEENKLLRAKTEALQAAKNTEEMYAEAIKAMGIYSGKDEEDNSDDWA